MRLGYSLLLGEHLEAASIDYGDCGAFQITCPNCREPVFKVRRASADTSHYLAHYRRNKAYADDCELRVAAITHQTVESHAHCARQQKLSYFLSVLRRALSETIFDGLPFEQRAAHGERSMRLLEKSKPVGEFGASLYEMSRRNRRGIAGELDKIFEEYLADITRDGQRPFFQTSFSIIVQKRIAGDVWMHLLTPQARANFNALYYHAYLVAIARMEQAERLQRWELDMCFALAKLSSTSREGGRRLLRDALSYPVESADGARQSSLLGKMNALVAHEMFGLLLRLPYFELLREAQNSSRAYPGRLAA